jgi:hypothetical protein
MLLWFLIIADNHAADLTVAVTAEVVPSFPCFAVLN